MAEVRASSGITLEKAAEASGESVESILAIESGEVRPTAELILKLSDVYRVMVKEFIGITDGDWVEKPRVGNISFGTGSTGEEASENLRKVKADQMPYWAVKLPDDITDEEFDALIVDNLRLAFNVFSHLNSFMHGLPDGFLTEEYVIAARLAIRDMWLTGQCLHASVTGQCDTMADKLLRISRIRGTFVGINTRDGELVR